MRELVAFSDVGWGVGFFTTDRTDNHECDPIHPGCGARCVVMPTDRLIQILARRREGPSQGRKVVNRPVLGPLRVLAIFA
jgi:hypothetical protein